MSQDEKKYGICTQTYIPVRKEPSERSEMITQLLFGESTKVLDDEGRWFYIRMIYDNYEGWIDKKCIDFSKETISTPSVVFKNSLQIKNLSNGVMEVPTIGSSIPELNGHKFKLGNCTYELEDESGIIKPFSTNNLESIIDEVLSVPYIWGGRSGFGFDCSGLVQYLCRVMGLNLPRDASEQAAEGETLSFINEVQIGDLAFFDDTEGMIHHVGMMLGNGKIVHASGTVRIDNIDQQGIFNEKMGTYTHKLRIMKRVFK